MPRWHHTSTTVQIMKGPDACMGRSEVVKNAKARARELTIGERAPGQGRVVIA